MNDIYEEIRLLEEEIEGLPKGTLVYKKINGKDQPYLQQNINGKSISKYVTKIKREQILKEVEYRNNLTAKLKELKSKIEYSQNRYIFKEILENSLAYNCSVLVGRDLYNFALNAKEYKKRDCYKQIEEYISSKNQTKVLILYGLRRTGKTTLIKQTILNMSIDKLNKAAFIQMRGSNTLGDLNKDLIILRNRGFKYIFVDEITILEDFIEGAALLPDIFVSGGMKIILSGTDSLGFMLAEDEQLYDRCKFIHTTFISYREFESVLGIRGIDNYILYGGTMSFDGIHYNTNTFRDKKSIDEYVDSAIANNIQHSLKYYQYGGHFRNIEELYENGELTNVINRVVEDTNHRFTINVLTKDFKSNDLAISQSNLRKDRNNPNYILDYVDELTISNKVKETLEILNKNEQKVQIKEIHKLEIEEYLELLDIIKYVDIETIPVSREKKKMTIVSQPGLRYSQAKILIEKLIQDNVFLDFSYDSRQNIVEGILSEIKGRMMEEIILLETVLYRKDCHVFKLQFLSGEFDMVVKNIKANTLDIFEIKYSNVIVDNQYRHLVDETKLKETEFRYGQITNKYVIYRGDDCVLENGIRYINVEKYLKQLKPIE